MPKYWYLVYGPAADRPGNAIFPIEENAEALEKAMLVFGNPEDAKAAALEQREKYKLDIVAAPFPPEAGEEMPETILGHNRLPATEVYSKADQEDAIPHVRPVEVPPTQYVLKDGRRVFVRNGISGATFKAFFLKPGKKSPHALPSPRLPWRDSETDAQRDLDALIAEGKGIFSDAATVSVDCQRHCPGRDLCCLCDRPK